MKEVGDDEETRELIERLSANARLGVSGQAEIPVPSRDGGTGGSLEWRLVVAHAVEGRPGVVYWAVDDITSRRQVEEVVREEQARFVDLLEHAPIGFYSVDETGPLSLRQPHSDGMAALSSRGARGGGGEAA